LSTLTQTPWPVDEDGLPTVEYLNTLATREKWDHFWDVADDRSGLHGFIHLTNRILGEPK
jgi:hypothetical protein